MVAALFLLVLWLAVEPSPTESRWRAVAREIERGNIAQLPPQDAALLNETIHWLVPHTGVAGPVNINGAPRPGDLHVYATRPAALPVTGCASGNAVYDAELNIIFVDQSIVGPSDLPLLGERG